MYHHHWLQVSSTEAHTNYKGIFQLGGKKGSEYNCIIDLQRVLISVSLFSSARHCLNFRGCSEMKGHHRNSAVVVAIVFSAVSLPQQLTCNLTFNLPHKPTEDLHNVHREPADTASKA